MSELYKKLGKRLIIRGFLDGRTIRIDLMTAVTFPEVDGENVVWATYMTHLPFLSAGLNKCGTLRYLTEEECEKFLKDPIWKFTSKSDVIIIREGGSWKKNEIPPGNPQLLQVLSMILGYISGNTDEHPIGWMTLTGRLASYIMGIDRQLEKQKGGQLLQ